MRRDTLWQPVRLDHEAVVQYHPPTDKNISYHPYCLHLWRPLAEALPMPPRSAVGPLPDGTIPTD